MFRLVFPIIFGLNVKAHAFDHNYAAWGRFLKSYVEVTNGNSSRVDYVRAKANPSALKDFVADVEHVSQNEYEGWSEPRRQAFLVNAYNAEIIRRVLDKNVPKSLKGAGGFFISVYDEPFFELFGKTSRLNRLEKDLGRAKFKTHLFDFALNHGAKGDPMLRAEAWRPESLDRQLDESIRLFLSDPERNLYDAKSNSLEVSKLFDTHKDDFAAEGGVRAFLSKYMSDKGQRVPESANIKYLPFDWTLNGVN